MRTTKAFPLFPAPLALALLALGGGAGRGAEAPTLDRALKEHAPAVVKHLRDRGYQNVGVLKFLVKKGDDHLDNAGPLNLSLANRLEIALVLANPDEKLGILERASAAVVKSHNRRASHLRKEDRAALFDVPYRLAWGPDGQVKADAFVTGVAEVSRDLKTVTVTLQAFGRQEQRLETVCTFTAATDARTLAEAGYSYAAGSRGPPKEQLLAPAVDKEEVIKMAVAVEEKKEKHPAQELPIDFQVLYNGRPVPVRDGAVREPAEDEKVTFRLANRSHDQTYGVVLTVNGENTLFQEQYAARQCRKWVLGPGDEVEVKGYQLSATEVREFAVLPSDESERAALNYGPDVGTLGLTVFRARKGADPILASSYDLAVFARDLLVAHDDEAVIAKGALPGEKERPGQLAALQALLRKRPGSDGRGIVVPGAKAKQEVQFVSFKMDPSWELSATIRYWKPRKLQVSID